MFAYRFLARGGLGTVNQFRWPLPWGSTPGAWVGPQADTTALGVYAQRTTDLPYWLHDELYRVELRGSVQTLSLGVLASELRLVERVDGWNESVRRDFGESCVERLRQWVAANSIPRPGAVSGLVLQYITDAVRVLDAGLTASVAHIARVAVRETPQQVTKHDESLAQSQWLQHHLGL